MDKFNFGSYKSNKEAYPAELPTPTPLPGYHFPSNMPLGF